jgi:hypothetical protein
VAKVVIASYRPGSYGRDVHGGHCPEITRNSATIGPLRSTRVWPTTRASGISQIADQEICVSPESSSSKLGTV